MLLTAVVFGGSMRANAASSTPKCETSHTIYYRQEDYRTSRYSNSKWYTLDSSSVYIYIKNLDSNAAIKNIKVTGEGVKAETPEGINAIRIAYGGSVKPSNCKVIFTVKQNGKTYNLSCKLIFKKASVVQTFTLGKKDYTSNVNKYLIDTYEKRPSASKAILNIQLDPRYKIVNITASYENGSVKKVKNGDKISTENLVNISVSYKLTSKPKYYQKPADDFISELPSPLYDELDVYFRK